MRDPPTGEVLLFHLGAGDAAPEKWAPCHERVAGPGEGQGPSAGAAGPAPAVRRLAPRRAPGALPAGQLQTFVERAWSFNGPWT